MRTVVPVKTRCEAGVVTVTLADPERRNVLSPQMVQGIVAAYDEAESDSTVHCVVLVGEGPAFCAGAELAVLEASANSDFAGIEDVYRGFLRVMSSPLPTLAVVNGPAVGAGLNLALACDLRLATTDAVFDSRFMALRLIPGGGHTWMLERSAGREVASAMVLFGERLDATAALDAGLVYRVFDDRAAAVLSAEALGQRLAPLDREFVTSLAALTRSASTHASHAQGLDLERYMQRWSTTRASFLAGVREMRSVVERRAEARQKPDAYHPSAHAPQRNGDA